MAILPNEHVAWGAGPLLQVRCGMVQRQQSTGRGAAP